MPELYQNLRSIALQRYDGPVEFLFVVQSRDDPALADIERIARENTGVHIRTLVSNTKPRQCTEKNAKLVFAAAQADARSEVLVFSEDKQWSPAGWLAALVTGLKPAQVGVASSMSLPIPEERDAASLLFSTWCLASIPYFYVCPMASGPSFAIRRRDYEDWKVAEYWLRAVADDCVLSVITWRRRKSIASVTDATGLLNRKLSQRQIINKTMRYVFCVRIYVPWVWLGAFASNMAKVIILGRAIWPAPQPALLALLAVSELGFPAGSAWLSARRFPFWKDRWPGKWRPVWAWTALTAPAAWTLYLVNFFSSAIGRQTSWTGIRYKVRGPYDVRVLD